MLRVQTIKRLGPNMLLGRFSRNVSGPRIFNLSIKHPRKEVT